MYIIIAGYTPAGYPTEESQFAKFETEAEAIDKLHEMATQEERQPAWNKEHTAYGVHYQGTHYEYEIVRA